MTPAVTFLIVLAIGIAAGLILDRFAGPGSPTRQIAGSTRSVVTSAFVGVAGAFVGFNIAVLLGLLGIAALIGAVVGAAWCFGPGERSAERDQRAGASIGAQLRRPWATQLSISRWATMALTSQIPPPTIKIKNTARKILAARRSRSFSSSAGGGVCWSMPTA